MKKLAIFFALAVLSTTLPAQSTSEERDRHELTRLESVWNHAHESGDADALAALWADDLEVAVPRMPVMKKADVVGFAKSGRMKFLRYETSDIAIRLYGDAAVVTGRLQRSRVLNGNQVNDDWRFTKVYVRQNGSWRVVDFHASDAAQP